MYGLTRNLVVATLALANLGACTPAASSYSPADQISTFRNAHQYIFDTDGNAINSTSGKIDYFGGSYLWYGNPIDIGRPFAGVYSWSSPDLVHWKSNGPLFDYNTTEIQTLCSGTFSGDCGRPHIVYNAHTQKYVLLVNAQMPGYAVFTSDSPTKGYTLLNKRLLVGTQPPATQAGDFSTAVIDGVGYLTYSLIDFKTTGASIWPPFYQSVYVQKLTADFLNTTGKAYEISSGASGSSLLGATPSLGDIVDQEMESPDFFKRGDYFYLLGSNTCGFCNGTITVIFRSKSFKGPWTRQIISGNTCGGQPMGVLTLPNPKGGVPSYLYTFDLFASAPPTISRTDGHGYIFQPLYFNSDGSVKDLQCNPSAKFSVDIVKGTGVSTSGLATTATDGSGEQGDYQVSCDLPYNQLYQTWASSKSGTLKEVGINIAKTVATGNLTVVIFKYSSNQDFFTPHYTWTTLASASVPPDSLSQSLAVVRVPVGAAVKAGDRLGIALTTGSAVPLCHLLQFNGQKYNAQSSTRTLFAIGSNQVSIRGKQGKTPPVFVKEGQEIKWYAIVA